MLYIQITVYTETQNSKTINKNLSLCHKQINKMATSSPDEIFQSIS